MTQVTVFWRYCILGKTWGTLVQRHMSVENFPRCLEGFLGVALTMTWRFERKIGYGSCGIPTQALESILVCVGYDRISHEMFRSILRTDHLGEDVLLTWSCLRAEKKESTQPLTAHVSSFAGLRVLSKGTRSRLTSIYLRIHTSGLAYLHGPFTRLPRRTTIELPTDDWQLFIGERLISAEAPIQEH